MNKSLIRWVAAWFVLIMVIFTAPVGAKSTSPVYILPVKSTIDGGTLAFFERSYAQAQDNDAAAIVLEIDTPGGAVWAAVKIRNVIHKSPVPTIAFVEEGAISAGTLLALVSETIVMAPGSTMGAAEPQLGGQRADAKSVSYWVGQLETAAEENGRDELVARAMADADFELPGIVKKGEILTLTPNKALELGMIDAILASRQEVLQEYGLSGNPIVEMQPEFAEHFVRIVTNPYVSTALLTIGLVGLILEVFTPGFGVFGITGLISLGLYFSAHIIGGMTGYEAILLFILGIGLLLAEVLFIPGFGIAGIGGILALVAGIILAAPTVSHGISSLIFALLGTIVLVAVSIKFLPTRNVWQRLILGHSQAKEEGYNAPQAGLDRYLGLKGVAITPLRPAGVVRIAEERVDVVTAGGFIPPGTDVKVIKVEGTRVVVEKVE